MRGLDIAVDAAACRIRPDQRSVLWLGSSGYHYILEFFDARVNGLRLKCYCHDIRGNRSGTFAYTIVHRHDTTGIHYIVRYMAGRAKADMERN